MLINFHLAAIVPKKTQIDLLQIPLSDELQGRFAENWQSQYDTFFDEIQEINFDPGYKPEDHERFCVLDYELPEWLAKETSIDASSLDKIDKSERQMDRIRGIMALAQNEHEEELMLFQNFRRYQIIKPGLSAVLGDNTYTKIEHPGLMLGEKLSAVYHSIGRKLLFHSFHNVNMFLPLSDHFRPASEDEIREILSHELFAAEELDVLAKDPSQWFRTRFALLKHSGILNEVTALKIETRSKGYDVPIQLSEDNEKIVFPSNKSDAKKLLQFLNEEIFRGAVTDELYKTNSKTKMNQ